MLSLVDDLITIMSVLFVWSNDEYNDHRVDQPQKQQLQYANEIIYAKNNGNYSELQTGGKDGRIYTHL